MTRVALQVREALPRLLYLDGELLVYDETPTPKGYYDELGTAAGISALGTNHWVRQPAAGPPAGRPAPGRVAGRPTWPGPARAGLALPASQVLASWPARLEDLTSPASQVLAQLTI